jgi:hypothetical protein
MGLKQDVSIGEANEEKNENRRGIIIKKEGREKEEKGV